jgi:hypothetical protein
MASQSNYPVTPEVRSSGSGVSATALRSSTEPIDLEDQTPVLQELDDVCSDPEFQSSHRNCEFLRFVVLESLSGRGQNLSERSLGVELFGRSETYDTGSDAVVRVRANDVRKRLIRHYEKASPKTGWQITLPPRSYQAVFTRHHPPRANVQDIAEAPALAAMELTVDPRHLTWRQLLTPTLFALVVCATMFRWQVLASDPCMTFWSTLLAGKSSVNLVVDSPAGGPGAIQMDQLRGLSPLITIASLFKVDVHFSDSAEQAATQDSHTLTIHLTQIAAETDPAINQGNPQPAPAPTENGILVEPGASATLWVRGRRQADIDREIEDLTSLERFPANAAEKAQQDTSYFIPLDEKMQLVAAKSAPASSLLPR